jgi:hypothetical protein
MLNDWCWPCVVTASTIGRQADNGARVGPGVPAHICLTVACGGGRNRTVQELLGYARVETTMISTQVLNRGGRGVQSPLDRQ